MRVSVIISNRNDTAMLALTVRSALEEIKAVPAGGEVVIVDNSEDKFWQVIKDGSFIPVQYFHEKAVQLHRQNFPCLFTARETAIRAARGEYILCLDSHMLVGRNMIIDLVNFMNAHRDDPTVGFAHAPISWVHQHERQAKHDRVIDKHELGPWGLRHEKPTTITWKGMPWICRKRFFWKINGYGALSQHRISWGGGDMHIGTKPWLLGYKNWAVPTSPGIHIGPFPKRVRQEYTYRIYSQSGRETTTIGFLVSAFVLGGEPMMERVAPTVKERFKLDINAHWEKAKALGEDEREWLLAHQTMSYEEYLASRPWEMKPDADERVA